MTLGILLGCLLLTGMALANPLHRNNTQPDLQHRLSDVDIEPQPDGSYLIVVRTPEGQLKLTSQEYIEAVYHQQEHQRSRGWVFVVLNITTWYGVLWVCLGLLGQLLFTGRMILQWLSSEKAKRSVVPTAFWWMSLVGATMLMAYFIWRKDIIGVLGQGTGWFIYVRNLWMIYITHAPSPHTIQTSAADPEP